MTDLLLTTAGVIMGVVAADSVAPHAQKIVQVFLDVFARLTGR